LSQQAAGLTISELARELVIEKSALGQNLKPLERDGLLTIKSGADRRFRAIALTPAGAAKVRDATALWMSAQRRFEKDGNAASVRLRNTLRRFSLVKHGCTPGGGNEAKY
jgi:DNA-binding MarR family transcriptional regulator